MQGIWVGLSDLVEEDAVLDCLLQWFPHVPMMTQDNALLRLGKDPWPPIVFSVVHWPVPDFPTYVGFDYFPGSTDGSVDVAIALSQRFSDTLGCRTICDGTGLGDDESTGWTVIWDAQRAYLANDTGTDFGDGEGGPVPIVRELTLPLYTLDDQGHLITVA